MTVSLPDRELPTGPTSEQLVSVAQDVWGSFLGLELTEVNPSDVKRNGFTTACVNISGAWAGSVLLECPKPLAQLAAAVMFDSEADLLSEDEVCDALGELVNMIGGNIKSLLPAPSHLSLPSVTDGDDYRVRVPGATVVLDVTLECRAQPLKIVVWCSDTA